MISKQDVTNSIFFVAVFISVYCKANAAAVVADVTDGDDSTLDIYRDIYLDGGDEVGGDVYWYGKYKRQASNRNGEVDDPLPRIPFPFEKVQEILRLLNKPKKSDSVKLKGWSANGMPFNVLYTPNSLQQRVLSSVNVAAAKKPVSPPAPESLRRDEYAPDGKDDRRQSLKLGPRTTSKSTQMRKHYLVIPQLFVSYGWGPLGK